MPPAARLGDQTSHGTPLGPGPGSSNVFIGGRQAWRATVDSHTCPLESEKPHVGGVVTMGSTTVFINGMQAARSGDIITESGPSNRIISGCNTVIIG